MKKQHPHRTAIAKLMLHAFWFVHLISMPQAAAQEKNETALPTEFAGSSPMDRLAQFKAAIIAKSKVSVDTLETGAPPPNGPSIVRGTYVDRFGTKMEKFFQGDALIDGKVIDYPSWPLVDNPWIHQDWEGDMRISDGVTERLYDVKNWTITERKVGAAGGK